MIIVITGATGVGKTTLSIALAKKYNAEIINADAIQIYKGLNIGSAKIKDSETDGIKHHLLSIKEVTDDYSIYDYQIDGRKTIKDILSRGKNVIIVGGSGLYIKSLLYEYTFDSEDKLPDNTYDGISTEELYQELIKLDKEIKIDKYNRRRVIRALNYYHQHHKSINTNNLGKHLLYPNTIFIGLTMERNALYYRIDERVDQMINDGLIEEVNRFYQQKNRTKPLLTAIGYKELYLYFDKAISLNDSIALIKRNSRRYAKRQITFFNHQFNIKWFTVNIKEFSQTITEVIEYIEGGYYG